MQFYRSFCWLKNKTRWRKLVLRRFFIPVGGLESWIAHSRVCVFSLIIVHFVSVLILSVKVGEIKTEEGEVGGCKQRYRGIYTELLCHISVAIFNITTAMITWWLITGYLDHVCWTLCSIINEDNPHRDAHGSSPLPPPPSSLFQGHLKKWKQK